MRVLYFSRDYTPHDHRFLSALAETEHQVFFLRLERRGRQLEDRPLPPQIQQVRWIGGQCPAHLKDGPALLKDLRRVIREIKPDLIHAGPIQGPAFLTALSGFHPLVSMSWGSDLLRDADRRRRLKFAARFALNHTDVLVGDCQAVQEKAAAFGFSPERTVLFPWGVDLQRFKPAAESSFRERMGWQDAFVMLSLRSWEPLYGVDHVVNAFVKTAPLIPELRLILLGGGSQAGLIHTIISRNQLEDRVFFGGQVSNQDLANYYQAADLYVSASHSDGSSVSLMEALACGTPALLSSIPGNLEWVTPEREGWFFPAGDPIAISEGILHAFEARAQLPEMRRNARCLAEERANWAQNFAKLETAYQMAFDRVHPAASER